MILVYLLGVASGIAFSVVAWICYAFWVEWRTDTARTAPIYPPIRPA